MEQHSINSYHLIFEQCKSQACYCNHVGNADLVLRMLEHSTIALPILLTPLFANRIALYAEKSGRNLSLKLTYALGAHTWLRHLQLPLPSIHRPL